MHEMSLTLEARRYYRFFPAFAALENKCLIGGYQVANNLKAFCESFRSSEEMTRGVMEFYAQTKKFGYRLRDFNIDYLVSLDIPEFRDGDGDGWNANPRPRREWDGKPWEDDVLNICKDNDASRREERYLQYERREQRRHVRLAKEFELE